MLRSLLGEPPRENEGLLKDAIDAMVQMTKLLQKETELHKDPTHDFRKLEIWTLGLIASLDELEQCLHAASFFRKKVVHDSEADMDPIERGDYARYVFFTRTDSSACLPRWTSWARCSTSCSISKPPKSKLISHTSRCFGSSGT